MSRMLTFDPSCGRPGWQSVLPPSQVKAVGLKAVGLKAVGLKRRGARVSCRVSLGEGSILQESFISASSMPELAGDFAPRMEPGIAVAAVIACVPPVVYWGQVFMREFARRQVADKELEEREELKRRLFGDK